MSLFEGYGEAYGLYRLPGPGVAGEKNVGEAATIKKKVTDKNYDLHLRGQVGLGVIPITEKSEVKFGAIDIDVYDLDHQKIIQLIVKHKMPLVVCRSKSGGAHCFMFMDEFCPAKLVQGRLREMAGLLGYGTCEIYPKQVEILVERGDIGQWINIPYFNQADTPRYAYDYAGKMMTLSMFLDFAERARVTQKELESWNKKATDTEELVGGPPCLNILVSQGFPQGTRNNGLFNLGVYAMRKDKDNWEKLVVDLNLKYMQPPLSPEEVMGVIKSLKKREYNYTCDQHPIQPHCNASKCRQCKFGVGTGFGLPVFGTLTKLGTIPPIWFLDVDGGHRLQLTTEQLQNQRQFQHACMEELNIMPVMPKTEAWVNIVQRLMENVSVIEVPPDVSEAGQCLEHLDQFLTGKAQANKADEILLGKPWKNNGRHYFRMKDFIAYMERNRFKHLGLRWICNLLRDNEGSHHFLNIMGKGTNLWSVPEKKQITGDFEVPDTREKKPFA